MCAISAVFDTYSKQVPLHQWTPSYYAEFQEIIRRLDALDKKLGVPDCEDPAKADLLKRIEERLSRLEQQAENS